MMAVKLFAALALTGCSAGLTSVTVRAPTPSRGCTVGDISPLVDAEILPFVKEFAEDATHFEASCYKVKDIFLSDTVTAGIAGYCQPGFSVVVSKPTWKVYSTWSKRTLIYHELGHCALNLDHGKEDDEQNIMNPYVLPDVVSSRNWNQLVVRLFSEAKQQ